MSLYTTFIGRSSLIYNMLYQEKQSEKQWDGRLSRNFHRFPQENSLAASCREYHSVIYRYLRSLSGLPVKKAAGVSGRTAMFFTHSDQYPRKSARSAPRRLPCCGSLLCHNATDIEKPSGAAQAASGSFTPERSPLRITIFPFLKSEWTDISSGSPGRCPSLSSTAAPVWQKQVRFWSSDSSIR